MKCLKVNQYTQEPAHCSIAAVASIANFYNKDIDYDIAKQIAYSMTHTKKSEDFDGLTTGEIGMLFNMLGFRHVIIYSSDIDYLDYKLVNKSKKYIIEYLRKKSCLTKADDISNSKATAQFLSSKYNNKIVIDYNFGDFIRTSIDNKQPILISFNWTMFFKFPNEDGDYLHHAVVCDGYNKTGARIVDSHHEYYKYKLKRYKKGKYTIGWENLMSIIGFGDLVLPTDYVGMKDYELV